jgi:hypothetical protein
MSRRVGLEGFAPSATPTRALDEVICHLYTASIFGGSLAAHQRGTPDLDAVRAFALKEGTKMARVAIRHLRKRRRQP